MSLSQAKDKALRSIIQPPNPTEPEHQEDSNTRTSWYFPTVRVDPNNQQNAPSGGDSNEEKIEEWSKTDHLLYVQKINKQKLMVTEKCICCLFLGDKLPSNLAAQNNKCLLSHCSYGSGIRAWLCGEPLSQSVSQGLCCPGLQSHLKAWLEKYLLPRFLMIVGWRPYLNSFPHGPLHRAARNRTVCFDQASMRPHLRWKPSSFCN